MSRHTTSFTTDPQYRARQELRNRLERIRDEAKSTAQSFAEFPGNESEVLMWQALDAMCDGYINGINQINDTERRNKTEAASAARLGRRVDPSFEGRVGYNLAAEFDGAEPA